MTTAPRPLDDEAIAQLFTEARTRALGLACGPMSGFDAQGVNRCFFSDGRWEADFLINLGYPAGPVVRPRGRRLGFEQACVLA